MLWTPHSPDEIALFSLWSFWMGLLVSSSFSIIVVASLSLLDGVLWQFSSVTAVTRKRLLAH